MYTMYSLIISVYSVSLTHQSNIPGTGPLGHWGTGSSSNDFQGAPPKWITGPPGQSSGTSGEHQQSATDRRQVFQTLGFPWFDPKTIGETHEITTKITKCQDLGFPMFPYFKIFQEPHGKHHLPLETREPAMLYSSRVASSSASSTPL